MPRVPHFLRYQVFLLCSALFLPYNLLAQTTPVPIAARDASAVALAGKALQALTGGTALTDITIQANATYTAGSDQELGPATLIALGNQRSRMTLNLTSGQRQEIRSGIGGVWVGADGVAHTMLSHNNFVDASWFYPAFTLSALASDPTLAISLVGQEVQQGESVYHLVLSRVVVRNSAYAVALIQHISTMHLFLDAVTLLPAALDFDQHPDDNSGVDIPVEIRFGAYQTFNGVQAPVRIQKWVQNSLVLDLAVAEAGSLVSNH